MRKLTTLLLSLLFVSFAFGKSVSFETASQVANNYFALHSGKTNLSYANSFSKSYNGITTYYVFNYTGGGFVVVSADDAATPILAQSNEGFIETEITNPSTQYWFDCYSKEIAHIVASGMKITESLSEWNKILNNEMDAPLLDVGPLCTTLWDQGQWYNFYCPAYTGPNNSAGKALTGCVATAMGQVMKYHNFPPTGVGSHTYTDDNCGTQSVNFGATNYNFAAMGNQASGGSYQQIATLLYHAGVSVNMDYGGATGSGAFSEDVPYAMSTYFNYDNASIDIAYKSDYTTATWKTFLKSELDASRPLYYSGSGTNGGHAWVCDGYRTSDDKFHMNWGWSGASNGYFAIGALNTPAGNFNSTNAVVYGIEPGNPDLIVRFTDLEQNNSVAYGPTFDINCSVITGTPTAVNLYIDNVLVFNTTQTTFAYPWNTAEAGLGTHLARVEAIDATDTVYQQVNIGLSEWILQNSGLTAASRGIGYIHALDSLVVWATATDGSGSNPATPVQDFIKTIDGGTTWTPGIVNNASGLSLSMINAMSKDTAYVAMYKTSGSNPMGIYVTRNGGTTWARQSTASFSNAASFPNVVHFFDKNEGFCMGDPINNEFEIYTTTNGGTNWTAVPGSNIPNPLTGEFGIVGYYDAVGNKSWFGTNKGRIYRSVDKGLHWDVSQTQLTQFTDVRFMNELRGIAKDRGDGSNPPTACNLSETSDGGVTWSPITVTGTGGKADIGYVPGTENTWVSTESDYNLPVMGAYYSFDGGHSWAHAAGTEEYQFISLDFVNNHCGWAGSFITGPATGGIFKYVGLLDPATMLYPVTNVIAQPFNNSVNLTWNEPATVPVSYNVYRNDTLIANTTVLLYNDYPVANGQQIYCVTAVYTNGESPKSCTTAWITVGIPNTDEASYRVYPNPASEVINVVAPVKFTEVRIINNVGQVVYRNSAKGTNLHILTAGFDPGMYILQIYTGTQLISKKISIIR